MSCVLWTWTWERWLCPAPVTDGRASLWGIRTGEQESCFSPAAAFKRVGSEPLLVNTVEPALVMWVQVSQSESMKSGELVLALAQCCIGWVSQDSAGELASPGVEDEEVLAGWPRCYHQGPEWGLWVGPPQDLPMHALLRFMKRACHAALELQELHDSGQ